LKEAYYRQAVKYLSKIGKESPEEKQVEEATFNFDESEELEGVNQ
jgi:hypothetical protein